MFLSGIMFGIGKELAAFDITIMLAPASNFEVTKKSSETI